MGLEQEINQESYLNELSEAEKLFSHEEEVSHSVNYSHFSKEEIVAEAQRVLSLTDVKLIQVKLQELRDAFDDLLDQERPGLIRTWVEEGKDPRDFVPPSDSLKSELLNIISDFKKKKEEERKRQEEERLENLKQKQAILEKIKVLVDSEETDQSLSILREYMKQWKEVRQIPKEYQEELFSTYKIYIDKFYNQLSLFNELKDLDKEKNLEIKIDLIKKAESLKDEANIRKAMIALNKYHEDWKNTGPVRSEISEDLWKRFKAASDIVIDAKKEQQAKIDNQRLQNQSLKQLLIEKGEVLLSVLPTTGKEWNSVGKELDGLLEEWKKIGPVPQEVNDEMWQNFKGLRNRFYGERKHYFKDLNSSKKDNLVKKQNLCERAEALKDGNEFNKTADALQQLQEEWKKIGPVPEEQNDAIWKRFRAAFDHFYTRRNAWIKERKSSESEAVTKKQEVIDALTALSNNESIDPQLLFKELKEWQQRWNQAGFVSGKTYHKLQTTYQELADGIFQRFKNFSNAERQNMQKSHFEQIAKSDDGKRRLQGEDRRIKEKINTLLDEIATLENNKSFFQHSKNAGAVMKQFEEKIAKAKEQIDRLKAEQKMLKSMQ